MSLEFYTMILPELLLGENNSYKILSKTYKDAALTAIPEETIRCLLQMLSYQHISRENISQYVIWHSQRSMAKSKTEHDQFNQLICKNPIFETLLSLWNPSYYQAHQISLGKLESKETYAEFAKKAKIGKSRGETKDQSFISAFISMSLNENCAKLLLDTGFNYLYWTKEDDA